MLNLRYLPRHLRALRPLRPFPGRLEFAIRTALICVLTTLAVEYYQTPEAALTVYVVFFVIKPDRVSSVMLSIAILVLISLVIGIVMLITRMVIDEPLLRLASMLVISFLLLFATSASKLRPIGTILAMVVVYALDLISNAQIGELATRALLYGWLIAGFPAAICIVINLLIGPAPRQLAERALVRRFHLAASVLRSEHDTWDEFEQVLQEGTAEISKYLKLAGLEKTSPAEDLSRLNHVTDSITAVLLLVDTINSAHHPHPLLPTNLRHYFSAALDGIAESIRTGEELTPFNIDTNKIAASLSQIDLAIAKEFSEALRELTVSPIVSPIVSPANSPANSPTHAETSEDARAESSNNMASNAGFFVADAFSNPEHVRFALKTTAAALICYLIYSALSWPGIHTCLITCYVVALGTTGHTLQKLHLRVLGCLIGAAFGLIAIVFVMPDINAISAQLLVVFVGALVSAWVAAGSSNISYAGFQIALAFFMCVIQGDSPSFNMVIIRDRVIGILLGNLVVYLTFTYLWPVSIAQHIDKTISDVLLRLSDLSKPRLATSRTTRNKQINAIHTMLNEMKCDLDIVRFEPRLIRPTAKWLELRQQTMHHLHALLEPLSACLNQHRQAVKTVSLRLERQAHGDANNVAIHPPHETKNAASSLDDLLELHMQSLERVHAQKMEYDRTLKDEERTQEYA